MTAQLSPQPVFQAFAPNGGFLVGGQLFTYVAGTTTPQATYIDSTQTTQNTNPVILNAMGQANVWLNPTLAYKYVLQDSASNPLWSVDNINAPALPVKSVFDYLSGAQIADVQARTHLLDITTPLQTAINAAGAGTGTFSLYFPNGDYTVSAQLNINASIQLIGVGAVPYVGSPLGTGQRGSGAWFYFNHAGKGLVCQQPSAGNPISGIELRQFGTFRNQPIPAIGWAPNANDYDIWCDNVDILIDDVMLLNATAGVYFKDENLNGYGRIDINRLRGQVFNDMIHIDSAFDVCKISNIQRWPFWCAGSSFLVNVQTYENQNANVLYLARCDSPLITNVFGFNANALIRFAQNSFGATTYAQFNNISADNCIYGIWVDSTVNSGVLAQFGNLIVLAPSSAYIAGSNGIRVDGNRAQLDFVNCELRQQQQNAVQVNGLNNRVSFSGDFQSVYYNQSNGGYTAIQISGTTNNIVFNTYPIVDIGQLLTVGTLTGTGSNGTYTGITLNGGSGGGAIATVTVTAGAVSAVTVTVPGQGYALTDTLSFVVPGGSGTCQPATLSTAANKYGGGGATGNRIWVDDYIAYTPTIASGTGTITTLGAVNCWYRQVGSTITINYDVSITTNGTAATSISIQLPPVPTPVNTATICSGRELTSGNALTSVLLLGSLSLSVTTYNSGYPGGNGTRLVGSHQFECTGLTASP